MVTYFYRSPKIPPEPRTRDGLVIKVLDEGSMGLTTQSTEIVEKA